MPGEAVRRFAEFGAFSRDAGREISGFAKIHRPVARSQGRRMHLTLLPPILLALAEQRSLDAVLTTIVSAVMQQPGLALARVWLRDDDRSCPVCVRAAGGDAGALHLRASAGAPLQPGAEWSKIGGVFHRVPLDAALKIARIAQSGEPIRIDRLSEASPWVKSPEWVAEERLVAFAGRPLVFRGEVLGVLGAFRRVEFDDESWAWLQTLSDAAAVAVANARAFEAAERLRRELERERDYLREEVREAGAFGDILGSSGALAAVLRDVEVVAATGTNVLILGESGTGKELIARALHARSVRAQKPLVKVNCGSIPRELFESEFFGHVRGSFTGAVRDRIGRFQLADGGTLFLDEVGEIPLDLQAKLLRVLQEGEFERVGDDMTRRVNVRVIAATNRDLQQEIADGRFRLDLFYRLGVIPIVVPPLRDRRDDIPELLAHFVRQCCARLHLPLPRLPQREVDRAQAYDWPGNIRELQNVVERAVILARGGPLSLAVPAAAGSHRPAVAQPEVEIGGGEIVSERRWREMERGNVLLALRRASFRLHGAGGAADLLGIHPATLASRLKKMGIQLRAHREEFSRPSRG
ncbi:MAG TPA: sigma 54-interacting transcriptional regulator [Vicinamibacterales bacterium]|nr:sigma 54-interacting transcriptional regulator [Vicinamibacterales bacterium]